MKKLGIAAVIMMSMIWLNTGANAADPVIGPGKTVKLDYTLFVNDKQVETSVGKTPLVYTVGDHTIIPGLATQLNGLHVGDQKVIKVAPQDAYGTIDPKAFKEFPKTSLPKGMEPKVGMVLQATAPDGEKFPATISKVNKDTVELNFNHPLAGKELKFEVKILAIDNAAPAAAAQSSQTHT